MCLPSYTWHACNLAITFKQRLGKGQGPTLSTTNTGIKMRTMLLIVKKELYENTVIKKSVILLCGIGLVLLKGLCKVKKFPKIQPQYYHKITEYGIKCCMHAHHVKQGRIVDAKLYFWTIFQFFFIQMRPGPTHPLPIFVWIFGIFLTLQSPLGQAT